MKKIRVTGVVLFATILFVGVTALLPRFITEQENQQARDQSARADVSWAKRVTPGTLIEIKGLRGNITSEVVSGDRLEIRAIKHGLGNHADVSIQVAEYDGGMTICA